MNHSSRHLYKILFGLLLLFLLPSGLSAQRLRATYPVQATAYLKPPYSLYLNDYSNSPTGKIVITLYNRDLMQPETNVRLRLQIISGAVTLETIEHKQSPVFRLIPGVPYQLTPDEAGACFSPENFRASGVFNGRFPEGMLQICITVFEANTGQQLSQTACIRAWISLNRPPQLNIPLNGGKYPFREPQNYLFQWAPRHQNLSQVEYILTLKELYDTNTAPEAAFQYSQEVFSTTLNRTSYAYTAMDPPLLDNVTYAWQVQAVARDGFSEANLFENNGYSEIWTFSMAPSCLPPTSVSHRQEVGNAIIEWTPAKNATQQVVSLRTKDDGEWANLKAENNYMCLTTLVAEREYEYKVGTLCSDGSIVFGEEHTLVLDDWRKKFSGSCGILPEQDLEYNSRLEFLRPGDVFTAGDFHVTVTFVEGGSNGIFSGTGWIRVPMFMESIVVVNFKGITLNASRELIGGFVENVFDANESRLADLDAITHGKTGTGQTVSGDIWANVKADFEIPENPGFQYDQNSGTLTVTDQNGNTVGTITIPEKDREIFDNREPFTYVIEDAKGNIYTVTGDGKGNEASGGAIAGNKTGEKDTSGSGSSFNPGQLETKDLVVIFKKSPNSRYAFDTWQEHYKNISLINNKNLYEHLGAYEVPCKLVPPGKTDVVAYDLHVIKKGGIDVSKLVFKTGTGYILKHDSISHELTLNGGNANDALDVYALYPDDKGGYQTVGKLKVLSYSERSFNLVLVPVNGNSPEASGIQTSLNSIFNPLGISWNVSQDENFKYPVGDIRSDGSGLLSQYPAELSALNSAYKKERGANKNTVYLFLLGKASIKDADPGGFMPRGKQFGYLFTENGGGDGRTVAHEIGHGLFRLQHTFDGEYGREAATMKGRTDNLMDYGGGTHLAKWQWDEIFSPALLVNPFEGDDDAMAVTLGKFTENGFKINKAGQAIAPSGYLVNLPSGAEIHFLCDDGNYLEPGILYKFSIGNDTWVAKMTAQSWGMLFEGYLKNGEKDGSIYSLLKPRQGDQVIRVYQHTNVKNERELSVSLVKIKDSNDPNSFDVIEKSETQKVGVACGNTEYWNSLKPGLESLNRQLNGSWGVNVIDRDGNSYSLVTGSQGTITYKYDKNTKNWTVDIPGIANEEVKQIITGAISQKLNAFRIDENGKSQLTTTVSSFSTEDGGEFSFGAGLHWYEWGPVLCDAGISIYETARLPETYWNQNNPKYKGYPLHASPTFCGVADGAIEEIIGTAQLVKLGLEIVTDKEKAKALWESIKNINLSSIKEAAVGAIKDKWDRYANSPNYITYHELGKDGVQIASLIYGGFAAKGKKLQDAVEESGEIVTKQVRKAFTKSIDDAIDKLKAKAKYVLDGTGKYGGTGGVGGHHPLAKVAFEGVEKYDLDKAFSVSTKTLENVGGSAGIHNKITGQQSSLYSAWKKTNPNTKLTIDDMANIEIKAMTNVGIPEDIATGWIIKALEDMKLQGVTEIKNIPWNGIN